MYILSVDDSKTMRHIIGATVELLGYGFLEAEDGVDGLRVVEAHSSEIALILLDWNMPEMDGFTFLQKIKADERFRHLPVIMVTTEDERFRIIEAIKAGAKQYVVKPFTQEALVGKICECLGIGI
jgi:two-component system chemotaxis response regulator CheY